MPRPPYWICTPRTPTCRNGHPFITNRNNEHGMTLEWRGDMHLYLTCSKCKDHSFGILHARPSPLLHMYAVDEGQFQAIVAMDDDTMSSEVLTFLGYMEAPHAA